MVHEIVVIYGIDQMVQDAKAANTARAEGVVDKLFGQLRAGLPQAPEAMWSELRVAADEFVEKAQASWNPEESIRIWEGIYLADFNEDELRLILENARTPLGQKLIATGKRANAELQKYIMERSSSAIEEAANAYIAEVQRIVAEGSAPAQ